MFLTDEEEATATTLALTSGVLAANIPVTPTKLIVVDKLAKATKAKAVFVAKDPAVTKGADAMRRPTSQSTARVFPPSALLDVAEPAKTRAHLGRSGPFQFQNGGAPDFPKNESISSGSDTRGHRSGCRYRSSWLNS